LNTLVQKPEDRCLVANFIFAGFVQLMFIGSRMKEIKYALHGSKIDRSQLELCASVPGGTILVEDPVVAALR